MIGRYFAIETGQGLNCIFTVISNQFIITNSFQRVQYIAKINFDICCKLQLTINFFFN